MKTSTIAAISTPLQPAAIGMVRLSGPQALEIAHKLLQPHGERTPLTVGGYTAVYGKLLADGEVIDDGVMFIYRAPRSYTGEDVVEICCHGSPYIVVKLLGAALDHGAVQAAPGEFTMRAFLHGKMDLAQAESVADQIAAHSRAANRAALGERAGTLSHKVEALAGRLLVLSAHIAAWCDYPEEDVEALAPEELRAVLGAVNDELAALLASYRSTRFIKEGIPTAIVGKPNVGKSTLMNFLSGTTRSIVTDIPGTTRDVVENTVVLDHDLVLNLADTAGIHKSDDPIETIGIRLANERLAAAALVLAVVDGSLPLSEADRHILQTLVDVPYVLIMNKADKGENVECARELAAYGTPVKISAKEETGREALASHIRQALALGSYDPAAAHIANERQYRAAGAAQTAVSETEAAVAEGVSLDVVGMMIENALNLLYEISGKTASEDIIEKVFQNFCVGK